MSVSNNRKKDKNEKDLEKLAKKLLSMPHKPREESKVGKRMHRSGGELGVVLELDCRLSDEVLARLTG